MSSETIFEVKRFGKAIFFLAFLAAVFAVSVNAQSPSQTNAGNSTQGTVSTSANSAAPAQNDGSAEEKVPPSAPAVFYIGQPPPDENVPSILAKQIPAQFALPVTNSIICTWIVAAIILIIVRVTTWKNIKEIPSGMQNLMESLVEGLESLIGDIVDKRVGRWVFPFAATFLIFIVMCNFVDLIPGVGSIGTNHGGTFTPLFRPPTTDANLTVMMAGLFLVMSVYWALRYNGVWGLVKHVFGVKVETNKWAFPLFFLLFVFIGIMESLSILIVRPVALAMRLYGNIFGGENVLDTMLHHKNFFVAVLSALPFYFYEVFVCLLQAFVFALLVVAFVGTLCTPGEEHGHK